MLLRLFKLREVKEVFLFVLDLIAGTFLHTVLEMAETDSDILNLDQLVPQSAFVYSARRPSLARRRKAASLHVKQFLEHEIKINRRDSYIL